jgi:hypothetical protein
MNAVFRRRIDRTWLLLAALTSASIAATRIGLVGVVVNGAVLVLAIVKARSLLWNFLDIRAASSGWRTVFLAWLLLIAVAAWAASAASLLLPT